MLSQVSESRIEAHSRFDGLLGKMDNGVFNWK
jgi:hypothetical protein